MLGLVRLNLGTHILQRDERIVKDQIQLAVRGALHFEVLILI